jgi:hypothetical protein
MRRSRWSRDGRTGSLFQAKGAKDPDLPIAFLYHGFVGNPRAVPGVLGERGCRPLSMREPADQPAPSTRCRPETKPIGARHLANVMDPAVGRMFLFRAFRRGE